MQDIEEGLRERKKRRTRERIEYAGLRLMTERGYRGVSIDEIAAAAEVSPRTFYRYFATKDDLILGHQETYIAVLREAVQARMAAGVDLGSVIDTIQDLVKQFENDPEYVLLRASLIMRNRSLRRRGLDMQREWGEAIEDELRRADPELAEMAAAAIGGAAVAILGAAVRVWVAERGRRPLHELVSEGATGVLAAARRLDHG